MRRLRPALFPEGRTDVRFLGPVLRRACLDLANRPVEIPEHILDLSRDDEPTRAERIRAAVEIDRFGFDVLFVHSDGASDWRRAHDEQAKPGIDAAIEALGNDRHGYVAVVPVRETEAWAIADGDALRRVLGTRMTNKELGLPERPVLAEHETDPKACLREAVRRATAPSRRRRSGSPIPYALLGEQVDLAQLRLLPAYERFESDLGAELERLGYRRAR